MIRYLLITALAAAALGVVNLALRLGGRSRLGGG